MKFMRSLSESKSETRCYVSLKRPELEWSNHDQGESWVILCGGPNRPVLKNWRMNCG